jgi:hypothetical protein
LLLKNRLAFPVLLASVFAAVVFNLGGLFLLGGMEVMRATGVFGFYLIPHCLLSMISVGTSGTLGDSE